MMCVGKASHLVQGRSQFKPTFPWLKYNIVSMGPHLVMWSMNRFFITADRQKRTKNPEINIYTWADSFLFLIPLLLDFN